MNLILRKIITKIRKPLNNKKKNQKYRNQIRRISNKILNLKKNNSIFLKVKINLNDFLYIISFFRVKYILILILGHELIEEIKRGEKNQITLHCFKASFDATVKDFEETFSD